MPNFRIRNDYEAQTIINALRIAANQYKADAEKMKQHGAMLLEDQFTRQVQEANDIANQIEDSHYAQG